MRALILVAVLAAACACKRDDARQPAGAEPSAPRAEAAAAAATGDLLAPGQVTQLLRAADREEHFGVYLGERKVGHARVRTRAAGAGEPGAFAQTIELALGTGDDRSEWTETMFYAAAPPHRLVELRQREASADGVVERRYENGNAGMRVHERVDGQARPLRRLPPSRATAAAAVTGFLDAGSLEVGQRAHYVDFDSEAERDQRSSIEVSGRQRRRVAGVMTELAILRERSEGEDAAVDITVAGTSGTSSVRFGDGLVLTREPEAVAKSDVRGLDIVGMAVPVSRPLGDPAAVDALHLIADLPDGFSLPSAPNQRVRARADGRYDVQLRRGPGARVSDGELGEALAPTAGIDARHPEIVATAARVTAGATSPADKVERLVRWVHRELKKDLTTNLSVASQILARRVGDCSEHSRLFVALARAAGLPAREVSGLVYMDDQVQRFGWHAWAEVALDGRWVAVDPSWGETRANATHLTLGAGDDSDWIAALGNLRLEVAE